MRTTSVSGSADLWIAPHANIFPRTLRAGAPHDVVTSTPGSARPISNTSSKVTVFLRASLRSLRELRLGKAREDASTFLTGSDPFQCSFQSTPREDRDHRPAILGARVDVGVN